MGDDEQPPALPPDPVVDRLITNADEPEERVALHGHPGRSARPGHDRLYFDRHLQVWGDFPSDAKLAWETLPHGETSARPLTVVWVPAETVVHTQTSSPNERVAELLTGTFTARELAYTDPDLDDGGDGPFATGDQCAGVRYTRIWIRTRCV